MAFNCIWGSKGNDDMIRQCFTACYHPSVRRVLVDEICADCPYHSTGNLSEKLSKALAEYCKKHDVHYPESVVVVLGKAKLTELLAENKSIVAFYLPTIHYRFENHDILHSHDLNEVTIAIRNELKDKDKIYKEKSVEI